MSYMGRNTGVKHVKQIHVKYSFYTCCMPKTPHMYYRCGTISHVDLVRAVYVLQVWYN